MKIGCPVLFGCDRVFDPVTFEALWLHVMKHHTRLDRDEAFVRLVWKIVLKSESISNSVPEFDTETQKSNFHRRMGALQVLNDILGEDKK